MRASKRSIKGMLMMLVVAAMVVPGAAQAAPADPTVIVFSNKVPEFAPWGIVGDPGWNDPVFGYDTIHPTSDALNDGSFGATYFMGVTDADSIVRIEITDGDVTLETEVWTAPTGSSQAIDGYDPGWFGLHVPNGFGGRDDNNRLVVTDLGIHEAETDPGVNPAEPPSSSDDAAHRGPSEITFRFTAIDPGTLAESATVEQTMTKYAGTKGDTRSPGILRGIKWPPAHWCHLAGKGADEPFDDNTLGGTGEGQCSSFAQSPIGAFPDVTWLFCIRETSNPHHLLDPSLPSNPFRSNYCSGTPSEHIPRGEVSIQGGFTDAPFAAQGIGSEITSVTVNVLQGGNQYMDLNALGRVGIIRNGPTAGFAANLSINDLEPNYPMGDLYQVVVNVTDAWGNSASFTSPEITVYPY
ncbi:MAG: hypothetical protein R3246_05090 [Acidimicrobiia bacterium]|nr:hypothetical protein [Acidimicrobiia bacterium]